jgi:hypothetical protein
LLQLRLDGKPGAWNSILFCSPGSEIGQLASLGAKRSPGVSFPVDGDSTERASHTGYCITLWIAMLLKINLDGSDTRWMLAKDG